MILEIVSPEAKLFSGEVTSVSLPGVDGSFQLLNNHAPIVSTLKEGLIKINLLKQSPYCLLIQLYLN
jgi:F-type H+-transporting ATPase subunit epsilon